jgi:mono/diheme cytochrome c family protein
VIAALWKNDLRHYLIAINFVAFAALIVYIIVATLSPKRASKEIEATPANQTPFLRDEDLEGRRLERVQGWALLFAAVIAIALPIYWLREPTRQKQSVQYFDKNAAARGAVLFASPGTPDYAAATSKQCANCHGEHGQGGTATTRINGVAVGWKAPPLNSELERFREDPSCSDPPEERPSDAVCEVTDIITYGRPGSPMQGWGVAGGGPLNAQSISDLVAFIRSIQLTPAQIQAQENQALAAVRSTDPNTSCPEFATCPAVEVAAARKKLDTDTKVLNDARTALLKALAQPATTSDDTQLKSQCENIEKQLPADPTKVKEPIKTQAAACGTYTNALDTVQSDQAALDWSLTWQKNRANVSDGQLLFEINCARCHTAGWSVFDPTKAPTEVDGVKILGPPGGGGGGPAGSGSGFNLRDGGVQRRFGSDADGGFDKQVAFVSQGSLPFTAYGIGGIGSGRMPGFQNMLTADQIKEIVRFERSCLDTITSYADPIPVCATPPKPETEPTTSTTTAAKGG